MLVSLGARAAHGFVVMLWLHKRVLCSSLLYVVGDVWLYSVPAYRDAVAPHNVV